MKNLLCNHQDTLFATNLQMRVSRCVNVASKYFISQFLSPDICFSCPHRQEPDADKLAKWNSLFLLAGGEGVERPLERILFLFQAFCSKCTKYNSDTHGCDTCDCPAGQFPIQERMRLEQFNCPLNIW
jgi:hypothetical protein